MAVWIYLCLILTSAMLFIPLWSEALRLADHTQVNYQGRAIPQSMGGIFPPVYLVSAAWANWTGLIPWDILLRTLVVVAGLGVLGLVDDIWGDAKAKGFGGHMRSLISHGQVTTGLIKAVLGFIIALWAVYSLPGFFLLVFWRALIVALSANLINLLDLRPGRSMKAFFLLALLYIWRVPTEWGILLLLPFLLTSLAYFPWDLAGKGMLGDAGANVLGGVLGLAVVINASGGLQATYLALLIFMHLLAERVSFTKLIAGNFVLRYLDNLGRHSWQK